MSDIEPNVVADAAEKKETNEQSSMEGLSGILSNSMESSQEPNISSIMGDFDIQPHDNTTQDKPNIDEVNKDENNILSIKNILTENSIIPTISDNNEINTDNKTDEKQENENNENNDLNNTQKSDENQTTDTQEEEKSNETIPQTEKNNNDSEISTNNESKDESQETSTESKEESSDTTAVSPTIKETLEKSPIFHTESESKPQSEQNNDNTEQKLEENPENKPTEEIPQLKTEETPQKTNNSETPKLKINRDFNLDLNRMLNQDRAQTSISSQRRSQTSRPVVTRKDERPQIQLSEPKKKRSLAEQMEAAERLAQVKKYPEPQHTHPIEHAQTSRKPRPKTMFYTGRRNQQTEVKAPPEFIEFITGHPVKKEPPPPNLLSIKNKEKESKVSSDEVIKMTDKILAGQKLNIYDPATIADVINELSNRRVQAMKDQNYAQSQKLRELSEKMRVDYRKRDRDLFYKDYIDECQAKLDEAKENQKAMEAEWKQRFKEFDQNCLEELKDLEARQADKNAELEEYWQSDAVYRKFNKKSPQLLLVLQSQKNHALTGDLTGAAFLQKITRKLEAQEVEMRTNEMQLSYDRDKASLINLQKNEITNLKQFHEIQRQKLVMQYNQVMETCKNRVKTLEKVVEESNDFEKFCAKKFKRPAEVVMPMTTTINGGQDIPTCGKMRAMPRNTNVLKSFRESIVSAPLNLPGVKMSKQKLRVIDKKPKKKKAEF